MLSSKSRFEDGRVCRWRLRKQKKTRKGAIRHREIRQRESSRKVDSNEVAPEN